MLNILLTKNELQGFLCVIFALFLFCILVLLILWFLVFPALIFTFAVVFLFNLERERDVKLSGE